MSETKVGRPSHDERIKKLESLVKKLQNYNRSLEAELDEIVGTMERLTTAHVKLVDAYTLRFPGDVGRFCPDCKKRVTLEAEFCPNCERLLPA